MIFFHDLSITKKLYLIRANAELLRLIAAHQPSMMKDLRTAFKRLPKLRQGLVEACLSHAG